MGNYVCEDACRALQCEEGEKRPKVMREVKVVRMEVCGTAERGKVV